MEGYIAQILFFAGNFAPRNWAFCQGQILSIAQNTALFSLLGTTYGGNGQTTFALPDLRGRVAVGTGQGPGLSSITLGQVAGTETTSLLVTQLPAHTHALNASTAAGDASVPTNALLANSGALDREYKAATSADTAMHTTAIGATGGSQPFSIRNPYLGMNYIICLFGIFPSRN